LTSKSDFFNSALNGIFREATENQITLEEDPPEAFDLLVVWLYRGTFPMTNGRIGSIFSTQDYLKAPRFSTPTSYLTGELLEGTYEWPYLPTSLQVQAPPPPPPLQPFATAAAGQPTETEVFVHIGAQTQYQTYSPEELRVGDYQVGLKYSDSEPPETALTTPTETKLVETTLELRLSSPENISHTDSPTDSFSLDLLKLCILAEKYCWASLFNAAVKAYIHAEQSVDQPIPPEHVDLVYERTYSKSPLRLYVIDRIISNQLEPHGHMRYSTMAKKHDEFLEDLLQVMSVRTPFFNLDTVKEAGNYYVPEDKDKKPGLGTAFANGSGVKQN